MITTKTRACKYFQCVKASFGSSIALFQTSKSRLAPGTKKLSYNGTNQLQVS